MAWCLLQVDLIATTTFWRPPNSTIRRAGAGVPLAISTPHAYLHTTTLLPNGMVLVAGGLDNNISSPPPRARNCSIRANGTWTPTGSLNTARTKHTATLLINGRVLVAGGLGSGDLFASAELFKPGDGHLDGHWQPEYGTRESHGDVAIQWHGACCGGI